MRKIDDNIYILRNDEGVENDGFWQRVNASQEYKMLNSMYKEGKVPWAIW